MTISVFSTSFISNKQVWGLPCLNSANSVPTLRLLKWSWCQACFMLVRAEPGHLLLLYFVLQENSRCRSIIAALDSLCEKVAKPFQTLPKTLLLGGTWCPARTGLHDQNSCGPSSVAVFPGCQPVTNWAFLPSSVIDVDVPGVCEPFWSVINKGREEGSSSFILTCLEVHTVLDIWPGARSWNWALYFVCVSDPSLGNSSLY